MSDATLLSREEARELAEDEPEQRGSAIQTVPIPASIYVPNWGVLDCDAKEGGKWGYTPYGIFATGQKRGHDYGEQDPPEHDVLFPYNAITAVEFDYPAFFTSQGLTTRGEQPEPEEEEAEDGDEASSD